MRKGVRKIKKRPEGFPAWFRDDQWLMLYRWANSIRGLYGCPVYLVGSALRKKNPRDIDIRIELDDDVFAKRFGDVFEWEAELGHGNWTKIRWRWSDECVKRTHEAWDYLNMNIDFQIYPKSHCRAMYKGKKKVRLDTRGR